MNNKPYNICFFGTPDFAVPTLQELISNPDFLVKAVVTQPDRKAGRGKKLQASPIKKLALKNNIPVLQPENIKNKTNEFIDELKNYGPFAAGVVIAFGQILPNALLNLPQSGCFNLHASLLPRWRGAAPIQRAILAGDLETGVCLMQMEEGLDTGPYYDKLSTEISATETAGSLHDRLSEMSGQLIQKSLGNAIEGTLNPTQQDDSKTTYAKKITAKLEKITWSGSAIDIDRKVRALSPYPAAHCVFKDKRIKILGTDTKDTHSGLEPGTISFVDKKTLEIATGFGTISIHELKPEGKRAMKIADFLAGAQLEVGLKFN